MKRKRTEAAQAVETAAPAPDRRRFLGWLWAAVGLAAMAEFCGVGVSFLLARKDRSAKTSGARIITAGPVEGFSPDSVTAIPSGQFFLARLPDGAFLALARTCTHLGCAIGWDAEQKRFQCPCHGSSFSLTGEVVSAPAPRPLDWYPARIENGQVKVDVAAPRRRDRFEPHQAVRI